LLVRKKASGPTEENERHPFDKAGSMRPSSVQGFGWLAKGTSRLGITEIGVYRAEIWMIKNVESLGSELQMKTIRDREIRGVSPNQSCQAPKPLTKFRGALPTADCGTAMLAGLMVRRPG